MGKFGWSLPPGCTQRHIDEAYGGDEEAVSFAETMLEKCVDLVDMDEAIADKIIEYAWKQVGEAYHRGYQQGQSDAHLAQELSHE